MKSYNEIPDLTAEQFTRFAQLIHERASITLKENKITLLSNRLRKRLRALDLLDFDEYYNILNNDSSSEMTLFLEVVTTNESYFWRTTQNFELLKDTLLPDLLKRYPGRRLKFWSAACSTGEEPYNLAIELIEGMKKTGVFDFNILGTDISKRVIDFAREGVYEGRKIEKIPPPILRRFFRPWQDQEGSYVVRQDIKDRIEFRVANLFDWSPPLVHCIFCRNAMIYFNREDQSVLSNRFFDALQPGGYLILGHSESLHALDTPFEARYFENGVVYQKSQ